MFPDVDVCILIFFSRGIDFINYSEVVWWAKYTEDKIIYV